MADLPGVFSPASVSFSTETPTYLARKKNPADQQLVAKYIFNSSSHRCFFLEFLHHQLYRQCSPYPALIAAPSAVEFVTNIFPGILRFSLVGAGSYLENHVLQSQRIFPLQSAGISPRSIAGTMALSVAVYLTCSWRILCSQDSTFQNIKDLKIF
ncbi:MAG: hypothetical protein COT73_09075 [Bdellovibrio sp. CG10_big_fil_rev_8_21_14_0_10_47_8]|nr:MAG: hypothetical protein COT73_09075 [Bdellovibrio sp. CG10_big_fil_rev_8_21_14_0_10_47_8]